MKYESETKDRWAEEISNDELIKIINKDKSGGTNSLVVGCLFCIGCFFHYIFGFIGIGIMLLGVVAHIRARYCQIIKLIKNKKEVNK